MFQEGLPDQISIDVTPLATIGLILVVIFLSSASTWTQQSLLKVTLPKAATSESERKQNLTVTIGANDELAIDDVEIVWPQLLDGLIIGLKDNKDKFVIIRADKSARYGSIMKVMGLAKQAGSKSITIATQQKRADDSGS